MYIIKDKDGNVKRIIRSKFERKIIGKLEKVFPKCYISVLDYKHTNPKAKYKSRYRQGDKVLITIFGANMLRYGGRAETNMIFYGLKRAGILADYLEDFAVETNCINRNVFKINGFE
jgi:hypothetical protein